MTKLTYVIGQTRKLEDNVTIKTVNIRVDFHQKRLESTKVKV